MTDVLHSATARSDACQVVAATATRLLPRLGGALHVAGGLGGPVIAATGEPLEFAVRWGRPAPRHGDAALCLDPACCWALKRQKSHLNGRGPGALRCGHAAADSVSLELPLIGHGEVLGLLELVAAGPDGEAELRAAEPLALLLAEAATRALTGIALRERLKNDAVRDGLTGLYNRRFLEELQERLALSAERRKSPLSAIMIDIDHFKRINDEHGHAAGDAVLRAVAVAAVSALRRTDLICRYGGEELVVLLPDCPLTHAVERAELLRTRIAELTENGITVTASLGVASIPETSPRSSDLFAAADRAMYQAKQQGRNRVVAAPLRPVAPTISLLASS
jgi:diguanylate cyclase (GGDEF)-like protein